MTFYSNTSAVDMYTLYAGQNIINRRNVGTDTHQSYAANNHIFCSQLISRIVVAAMQILVLERQQNLDIFPRSKRYCKQKKKYQ